MQGGSSPLSHIVLRHAACMYASCRELLRCVLHNSAENEWSATLLLTLSRCGIACRCGVACSRVSAWLLQPSRCNSDAGCFIRATWDLAFPVRSRPLQRDIYSVAETRRSVLPFQRHHPLVHQSVLGQLSVNRGASPQAEPSNHTQPSLPCARGKDDWRARSLIECLVAATCKPLPHLS